MIEQHQKALAAIKAAEREANALSQAGAKIPGVQQKLKQAREEIEIRIRYFEREAKSKKANAKPPAKPAKEEAPQKDGPANK